MGKTKKVYKEICRKANNFFRVILGYQPIEKNISKNNKLVRSYIYFSDGCREKSKLEIWLGNHWLPSNSENAG